MKSIYLDNNASTRMDPVVFEATIPYHLEDYSNPSSVLHKGGIKASSAITKSRESIADYLNVFAEDIIFTSGATESNNLAIRGAVNASKKVRKHIITSCVEHDSVLEVCRSLEKQGVAVTYIPVDKNGLVSVDDIEKAITNDTLLISIIAANNEIGTIQPIDEIGKLASSRKIIFHTDATQYLPTGKLNLSQLKADLVSFSGHKFYGPKGVGCLYVNSDKPKIESQILGGQQQRNIRSGTMNTPGIVGIGVATKLLYENAKAENHRISSLRDNLLELISRSNTVIVNGSMENRIPSNINITIPGVSALALAARVPEVMFSAGSACATASGNGSHVLKSLGLSDELIKCSIRLSIGRFTTNDEIKIAADKLVAGINGLLKPSAA